MLNCYYSEKVLGLQGVEIKNIENTEKEIYIEVELKRRLHRCPACGQETDRIHDYRRQIVKDIPPMERLFSCSFVRGGTFAPAERGFLRKTPFFRAISA